MVYFTDFNTITYDYTIISDPSPIIETIIDLTERVKLFISPSDLLLLCDTYLIPDGMTPERAASTLYNDPLLHWTILYINDIKNISTDWPISDTALSAFVTKKYGAGNENNIHHYEKMPEGIWVDAPYTILNEVDKTVIYSANFCMDVYGVAPTAISNFDYELSLNDMKRIVNVIKPSEIQGFVQSFNVASAAPTVLFA